MSLVGLLPHFSTLVVSIVPICLPVINRVIYYHDTLFAGEKIITFV